MYAFRICVYSLWAAFPQFSHAKINGTVKKTVPEKDKIYLAFMVSDGDAWHYCMKELLVSWNNKRHGLFNICWTIPSLFARFNPLLLEYIYDTKTDNDEFAQGPSGVGYMYPGGFPAGDYDEFLQQTDKVLSGIGVDIVNYWDISDYNAMIGVNETLQDRYTEKTPVKALLLGHSSHEGKYRIHSGVPIIEEWGNFDGCGTKTAEDIVKAVDEAERLGRKFVVLNVEAWGERLPSVEGALKTLAARADGDKYQVISVSEMAGLMLGEK